MWAVDGISGAGCMGSLEVRLTCHSRLHDPNTVPSFSHNRSHSFACLAYSTITAYKATVLQEYRDVDLSNTSICQILHYVSQIYVNSAEAYCQTASTSFLASHDTQIKVKKTTRATTRDDNERSDSLVPFPTPLLVLARHLICRVLLHN